MFDRKYFDDDIEIIEIDDYDIEIIEVDDEIVKELPSCDKKIKESFLSKVRSFLTGKKVAVVTTCSLTLIITLTGVFIANRKADSLSFREQSNIVYSNISDNVKFSLNDEGYDTVLVNGEYIEKGATAIDNENDYSDSVIIDSSNLDLSRVGTYHVIYKLAINKNEVKTLYRTIHVVDNDAPVIKLLGSDVYTMLVNDIYNEEGFLVFDNSNEDLSNSVVIDSNVDSSKPGVYSVKYSVKDSSGNESISYRTVIVKYSYTSNSNSVLSNSFTNNGIFMSGSVQNSSFRYRMLLKNKSTGNQSVIDVNNTGSHYYNFSLDVTSLDNGVYEFYLVNDALEPLVSNMTTFNRIVRAHVGNKLVTMSYDKNIVNMTVEDFQYLYDVVIDPGHGGSEYGAVNGHYYEKSINLEQSLYEKQRYEAHGLRVLLLRDTDENYGIIMGDDGMEMVDRKAFAVGYYGAVSKIIYSNHHNSSTNTSSAGWEILVPAAASFDDLAVQHSIADSWSKMYIEQVNPYYRFYTKDYSDGKPSNKFNGEIYSFDDYYSVIRVPYKLFGVQNVLYEGAYINNNSDMYWYYNSQNWKQLSEVKIKAYVESLGLKYIEP